MKKVKIEKFVDNKLNESYEVPVILINIAAKFLPESALNELSEKGINIEKMLDAAKASDNYVFEVEVFEKNIKTLVRMTLIN